MPIELGRGATGVTYKALDVDLRRRVALKVISERYTNDEAARRRFLRETRAAVSLRHANVASVFQLGKTGKNYFYAMEFVNGETLESLVQRSGQLEVKSALEIARQAAAGLAPVHKKSLVHRDIKPSNIMVSFDQEGWQRRKSSTSGLLRGSLSQVRKPRFQRPGFVGQWVFLPISLKPQLCDVVCSKERLCSVRRGMEVTEPSTRSGSAKNLILT